MLAVCWSAARWDPRVLGQGSEEFSRVLRAVMTSAVVLGLLGLALQATAPRPWVFGLIPLAGVLAVLGRLLLRPPLHQLRSRGRCALPVLVVGTVEACRHRPDRPHRRDQAGLGRRRGVHPDRCRAADGADGILGVPVLGDLDSVAEIVGCRRPPRRRGLPHARLDAQAAAPARLGSRGRAAPNSSSTPALMEVAGPRLHVDPVDGLPLLRLTRPTFTGSPWVVKHVVDRLGCGRCCSC